MGNCCGQESRTDNFETPGRVLGSTPAPARKTAPVPPKIASSTGGGGQTLGGGDGASRGQASSSAARAAEERAARAAAAPKGKLGQQLASERKGTMMGNLEAASAEERRKRDMQEGAEARNWN